MQIGAHRAGVLGASGGILHLSENLRFAQHHRIEPGRHAKRVAHGMILIEGVEVRCQRGGIDTVILGEPGSGFAQAFGVLGRAINFGAIAGRQDRRLARQTLVKKFAQRRMQAFDLEYHLLAQLQGRGVVVDAEGGELHGRREMAGAGNQPPRRAARACSFFCSASSFGDRGSPAIRASAACTLPRANTRCPLRS